MLLNKFSSCLLCNQPLNEIQFQCKACEKKLSEAKSPYSFYTTPFGDRVLYAFRYVNFTRQLMLAFKYGRQHHLSRLFAQELWKIIQIALPWENMAIVPVPSSWIKMYFRKYNPAELIAKELQSLSLMLLLPGLLRKKWLITDRGQAGLDRMKRFRNPSVQFIARSTTFFVSKPSAWIIVDDVFTTGTTLHACKKALLHQYPDIPVFLAAVLHG